jgi:hypothetical protein
MKLDDQENRKPQPTCSMVMEKMHILVAAVFSGVWSIGLLA